MKTQIATILTSVLLLAVATGCRASEAKKGTPTVSTTKPTAEKKSGHLAVNGVNYYYEIHGTGEPLLLLHGGLGNIDLFCPGLAELSKTRQVIAVDLHGHGRTDLGTRAISLIDQADDIAIILDRLGFKAVDAMGYSLGAGIAFRLAVQHPQQVRRLVLVSGGFAQDGFFAEMLPQQAAVSSKLLPMMKGTPMYESYVRVAPHPEDFGKLLDQMGAYMQKPYNWREDVKKVTQPTLLVWGDHDMFRPEHMIEFYKLLGEGQKDAGWQREHMGRNRLAILPNLTHYEIGAAPELVTTVLPFLTGRMDAPGGSQVATK